MARSRDAPTQAVERPRASVNIGACRSSIGSGGSPSGNIPIPRCARRPSAACPGREPRSPGGLRPGRCRSRGAAGRRAQAGRAAIVVALARATRTRASARPPSTRWWRSRSVRRARRRSRRRRRSSIRDTSPRWPARPRWRSVRARRRAPRQQRPRAGRAGPQRRGSRGPPRRRRARERRGGALEVALKTRAQGRGGGRAGAPRRPRRHRVDRGAGPQQGGREARARHRRRALAATPSAAASPPSRAGGVVDDQDADAARYDDLAARQAAEARAAGRARRGARRPVRDGRSARRGRGPEASRRRGRRPGARLPALEGAEAEPLRRRFDAAAEAWRARRAAWDETQARRAPHGSACAPSWRRRRSSPTRAEAARRLAEARKAWTGLQSMEGVDGDVQERYARAVARLEARQADARRERRSARRRRVPGSRPCACQAEKLAVRGRRRR